MDRQCPKSFIGVIFVVYIACVHAASERESEAIASSVMEETSNLARIDDDSLPDHPMHYFDTLITEAREFSPNSANFMSIATINR